jgi:putative transposase
MLLSYKYRLQPNREQRQVLDRLLEIHRGLYNDALTERRLAWKMNRKSISYADQANQLKAIRQFDDDAAFVNYTSMQQTLRRLDKAFAAFFRRVKAGEKPGYPRYKGRAWFKSICYVYGDGIQLKDDRLYVQRAGGIRMFQHRPLPDGTLRIKQVILKRDNLGNWYGVFQVELPDIEPLTTPTTSVGIDMGLEYFAALSTGETIENPRWFRASEDRLAKLQKRRSRCSKGSNQYRYLTGQIRRCHQKIANQRLDFHHKLSRELVNQYGVIFVEKLNINGLCQSHVSKSMADAGWSQFLFFLNYKAESAGGCRPEVDARRTSQLCPMCGCPVEKSLSIRVHLCSNCGYTVPRDVAASQVIELRGIARTEQRRKVFPSFVPGGGSAEAPAF